MGLVSTLAVGGTAAAAVTTLVIAGYALRHREVRGGTYLAMLAVISSVEAMAYTGVLLAPDLVTSLVFHRVYMSVLAAAGLFWVLFAAVWTGRDWVFRLRYLVPVGVLMLASWPLVWSNAGPTTGGLHQLWWTSVETATLDGLVIPAFQHGLGYWLWRGLSLGLFFVGAGFVAEFLVRPEQQLYRRQSLVLLGAVLTAVLLNVLFESAGSAFDPTPIGIGVANVLAGIAIYGFGFIDAVPMARQSIVEEVDTAIVVYDDSGTVVDLNQAARDRLELGESALGRSCRDVLLDLPVADSTLDGDRLRDGADLATVVDGAEFTFERATTTEYFAASVSGLSSPEGQTIAHGIVFHDVTAQREREEKLELLRQLLTRVLRHNIRNDLGVIRVQAQLLGENVDERLQPELELIEELALDVTKTSEDARRLEDLITSDWAVEPLDVESLVDRTVAELREKYPDVTIESRVPATYRVRAIQQFPAALREIIENAAEHNDSEQPRVSVRVERVDGQVAIHVRDNGPGIPPSEMRPVESREETPLEHGSGLGLWLVDWAVSNSNGEIDFESSDDGTVVTVRLDSVHRTDDPLGPPESTHDGNGVGAERDGQVSSDDERRTDEDGRADDDVPDAGHGADSGAAGGDARESEADSEGAGQESDEQTTP